MGHPMAPWCSLTLKVLNMCFSGLWDFGQQDHYSHQNMARVVSGDILFTWEMDWNSQGGGCWLGLARGLEALCLEAGVHLEPFG